MNFYSDEFFNEVGSFPIKKQIYVYVWKGNKISEYLAEFKLYEHEFQKKDYFKSKNTTMVTVVKNISKNATELEIARTPKTFIISNESGEVTDNKLWLLHPDISQALSLFADYKEKRIIYYLDKIEDLKDQIALLKSLKEN